MKSDSRCLLNRLVEGKVDVLITRHLGDHSGYRGECLRNNSNDPGAGDFLICPEGTANCPEIESLRVWLRDVDAAAPVVPFAQAAVRRLR